MDTTLVKHNGGGLYHIGIPAEQTGPNGEKYSETIHLMPGINVIDSKQWALAEQVKVVQYHLRHPKRAPMFEVTRLGALKENETPLTKLSADDAIAMVNETAIEKLLAEWANSERRVPVQAAIQARRDLLLPASARRR
jgi:hypothetical protein